MRIIPAVDILGGSAVRLEQGDFEAVTTFDSDPVAAVRRWGRLGADPIHVVDLDAARGGTGARPIVERAAATGYPLQLGGGIRSVADAAWALAAGVSSVVLGSVIVTDPVEAGRIVEFAGPDRVVAAIDVREGAAMVSGWLEEGSDLAAALDTAVAIGMRSALITRIERDGTMEGPDLALLERSKRIAPELALIASGGVGSLADVESLARSGLVDAVIIGKALYEGALSYPDAVEAALA